MFAEVRPNSHMLPSRTERNIRPNSVGLRHLARRRWCREN